MKRLIRKSRRNLDRASNLLTNLLNRTREKQGYSTGGSRSLSLEPLENRVLLTTLILEKGDVGETLFTYSDAGENTSSDVSVYNEIRIGTLSGQGPEQDVIVEVLGLDYYTSSGEPATVDIYGTIEHTTTGTVETVGGGPGGGPVFRLLDTEPYSVSALASDSSGNNYGISSTGQLVRYEMGSDDVQTTVIGDIVDTNNPFQANITFTDFSSADCAWGYADVDVDGDGDFDTKVLKEVIYAVVSAPLISDTGYVDGESSVLIMIDPLTGEAEPVATVNGTASYLDSEIDLFTYINNDDSGLYESVGANVTTIVFSEEGQNDDVDTNEPYFIGYNATSGRFIYISVDIDNFSDNTTVDSGNLTYLSDNDDDKIVTGLAYCDFDSDGNSDLFATRYAFDGGERSDGSIDLVEFTGLGTTFLGYHTFTEVITLDEHEDDGYDQMPRLFTGFTFDTVAQMGYATEDFTGMVYQVNLANLVNNDGTFSIEGNNDIYQIYIAQSTADTFITITRYTIDNGVKVYTPTDGDSAYLFTDEDDNAVVTPGNAGGVMIGTHAYIHGDSDTVTYDAVTFVIDPGETAPAPDATYGGIWANGEIRPGIVVEEGSDVGMISIGGSVFGDVDVRGGSIGTFYCGFLGTNSFVVNGDLQNLIVATQAGGINESDGVWMPAASVLTYDYGLGVISDQTTTVMDIMGQMGSFYGVDDWGMPIRVWGRDNVASFPGVFNYAASDEPTNELRDVSYTDVYREMEYKFDENDADIFFQYGAFDWIITNDTIETAQYLGTNEDGIISVIGSCESWSWDAVDYYSFGVMAGDEITIEVYDTGAYLNIYTGVPVYPASSQLNTTIDYFDEVIYVYDPNGVIIATSGEMDPLTNTYKPISFVADVAGVYSVAIQVDNEMLYYRMDISGVQETALGGGTVLADLRSNYYACYRGTTYSTDGLFLSENDVRPIVQVMNGNLGALNVNGYAAVPQVEVLNGNLAAFRVNGTEDYNGTGYSSVGLDIGDTGAGLIAEEPYVLADGSIGEVRLSGYSIINVYAHDDIQSFHSDADVAAGIFAYDDIGSVYVDGNFVQSDIVVSFIVANADGDVDPGIIDTINVSGYFSAIVSTGRNVQNGSSVGTGNVRYVYVGYRSVIEENPEDGYIGDMVTERLYDVGQNPDPIIDDSGAQVIIKLGYAGDEELVTTDDGDQVYENVTGGSITISTLPIYKFTLDEVDGLEYDANLLETFLGLFGNGHVITDITSTDGLRITTYGTGSVEVGRVTVQGVYDESVIIGGTSPVSVYRLEVEAPAEADTDTTTGTGTGTTTDEEEPTGITTIANTSGWYLDQNGNVFIGARGQRRTQWVGGDIISIAIGDVNVEDLGLDADLGRDGSGSIGTVGLSAERIAELEDIEYAVSSVSLSGNLGYSNNTTGQVIVAPLVYSELNIDTTPGGEMTNGLFSTASIQKIYVAGNIYGDIYTLSSVGALIANSDQSDYEGQFDGICAAVTILGNLGNVNVGDGLIAPGTGYWAKAGIFVLGDITNVRATGYDHDIAGAIIAGGHIESVRVSNGADIEGYNYVGTWKCPNISTGSLFREFYIANSVYGNVVDSEYSLKELIVSGADSEISGAYISTENADRIIVGYGAEGVISSYIGIGEHYDYVTPRTGSINMISIGGYGIKDSYIDTGYDCKQIIITGTGDIINTSILADYRLGLVMADDITGSYIMGLDTNINTLSQVIARGSIVDTSIVAGKIGKIISYEDITGCYISAQSLSLLRSVGDLISNITINGAYGQGYLGTVLVGGDFGGSGFGTLAVEGTIGIINVAGNFEGTLALNQSHQYYSDSTYYGYELRAIFVGGQMDVSGEVYGDIGFIRCGGDFGSKNEELVVNGNLASLTVIGRNSVSGSGDLLADLEVTGNLGSILTTGDIDGDITVQGNLNRVMVSRSSKDSSGNYGINGDITVGGNLGLVLVRNGDINGDINAEGTTGLVRTIGCGLYGATVITNDTDGLSLTGSIGGEDDELTSYVVTGDVSSIRLTGHYDAQGNYVEASIEDDAVILIDGDLDELYVSDDIMGTIYVTGNIGTIYVGGDISGASIIVGGDIGTITVKGAITEDEDGNQSVIVAGYDPGSGGTIDVDDFKKIDGEGSDDYWTMADWSGTEWADSSWIQSEIGQYYWSFSEVDTTVGGWGESFAETFAELGLVDGDYIPDNLQDAVTAAYTDSMQTEVIEAYTDYLLAKFTIQGDTVDPAEKATSGNITRVTANALKNSTIAAGVSPGSDGKFGDLNGTDKAGDGISTIGTVIINSKPSGQPDDVYGIFADGAINNLIISGHRWTIPAQVNTDSGFRAWEVLDTQGFDLQSEPGTILVSFEAGDPLSYSYDTGSINFVMTGKGSALVQIDTATGEIIAMQLKDTTATTSVIVTTRGLSNFDLEVGRIFTNDDSSLNRLMIDGTLVYSENGDSLSVNGGINFLKLNAIDATNGGEGDVMNLTVGGNINTMMIGDIIADSDTEINFDISGKINTAFITSVSTDVYIESGSIRTLYVREDYSGNIAADGLISTIMVVGKYDGLIYCDGDIQTVVIRGGMGAVRTSDRPEATIAATGNIRTVLASKAFGGTYAMTNASIVAGENINTVLVSGSMLGSDIVAGVILDPNTDLRDNQLEVSEGDINRVLVTGNFKESNIAAGVAPGEDGFFSTSDDILNTNVAQDTSAPVVEEVSLYSDGSGTNYDTIVIKFEDVNQSSDSDIINVTIGGYILESDWDTFDYAIIAAGDIGTVTERGSRYSGDKSINMKEVNLQSLNSAAINKQLDEFSDVIDAAIWIQVDGLDQRFSTTQAIFQQEAAGDTANFTDDSFLYEGATITYDEDTNSIYYQVDGGLLENLEGANYYKVIVRADIITNIMGVSLDGEYDGEMPSGNGTPGGNFVYTFAIADIGDLESTAFAPFDEEDGFPTNYYWNYSSTLGDNQSYTGTSALLDNDYYKVTNLEEGQILCVSLSNLNPTGNDWVFAEDFYDNIIIELQKVEDHEEFNSYTFTSVTSGIEEWVLGDEDAPTISSELSELFWSGDNFYGFDSESGNFFKINVTSPDGSQGQTVTTFDKLENDLYEINSTINNLGVIESLYALGGHSGDSCWAIATFTPANGTTRTSLVLIENFEKDINVNQNEQLSVTISDVNLAAYDIVGLAETEDFTGLYDQDILYAVSSDGKMYQLNSDTYDNTFGSIERTFATANGGSGYIKDSNDDDITDFNITGLSVSREGSGLLVLHDLPYGDYSSNRSDAIYMVSFDSAGNTEAHFWQDLNGSYDFAGLAANPDGYTLVGSPMFGTPVGDTFEVTYENDTQFLTFGSTETDGEIELQGGLVTINSNPEDLPQNYETNPFIENGMYYALNVQYSTALSNDVVIEINDIDFWKDIDGVNVLAGSEVDYAYSDNAFVNVVVQQNIDDFGNISSSLIITIDATYAGGEANVYFSADSGEVLTLSEFGVDKVDTVISRNVRSDTDAISVDHDLIMPNMSELTISPVNLAVSTVLEASDAVDYNLYKTLSRNLYNKLDGVITQDIISSVREELELKGEDTLLEDFNDSLVEYSYNAIAYDEEQELFALVNTETFETRTIYVSVPQSSGNHGETTIESELTLSALSSIYNDNNKTVSDGGRTTTYTINNIRGLEFGAVSSYDFSALGFTEAQLERLGLDISYMEDLGMNIDSLSVSDLAQLGVELADIENLGIELVGVPELWAIVEVTTTTKTYGGQTESITTEHLARIDDILDPDNNVKVATNWDLESEGFDNITELAFGSFPEDDPATPTDDELVLSADKNELYGFNNGTNSNNLVKFDISELIPATSTTTIANPEFGLPTEIGQLNPDYDITAMDFDSKGRLLAVENNGDTIIQIDTALTAGSDRSTTLQDLPSGDYSVLTFDSTLSDSEPILIKRVSSTVEGDTVKVRVDDGVWSDHIFGSNASTTSSGVVVSSVDGVELADGYHSFDIDYSGYTGTEDTIIIELDDIDWADYGDIDSVILSDNANAYVVDYDDNSITIAIDASSNEGSLKVYFGAAVDVLRPGLGYTSATTVYYSSYDLDSQELYYTIDEAGDYVVRIGLDYSGAYLLDSYLIYSLLYDGVVPASPMEYDVTICAFNDGDSSFGDDVSISDEASEDFVYENPLSGNSPVDLSSDEEWAADVSQKNVYTLDRATASIWEMTAKGSFLTAGEAGEISIYSELAIITDIDVYSVQLTEGQIMSVSLDGLNYVGGSDVEYLIGVYNSDLESVASIYTDAEDVIDYGTSDPDYVVQAIHTLDSNTSITIDPMEEVNGEMVGTYYIVVSLIENSYSSDPFDSNDFGDINPYKLTVKTYETDKDDIQEVSSPQYVYLSFSSDNTSTSTGNLNADYLLQAFQGYPIYSNITERDAFSLDDFDDLPTSFYYDGDGDGIEDEVQKVTWEYMVERITQEVIDVYREALDDPTTEHREDLDVIYITNDPADVLRKEHSTVVIGGDLPVYGVIGVAETIDRHNANTSDMAVVASKSIGEFYSKYFDSTDDAENVDRAVSAVAGTAIHELGHILGLEHSTEVNPDLTYPVDSAAVYAPDNVMNYNPSAIDMSGAKFETRNAMASTASGYFSYTINQPGYQNEVDMLLRNLGTTNPYLVLESKGLV